MIKRTILPEVQGYFTTCHSQSVYRIENYDLIPPFLISLVNASDLWLYISSKGCLTAGRVSPDVSLFPYENQDRLNNWSQDTGSFCKIFAAGKASWSPFAPNNRAHINLTRCLDRTIEGDALWFEETNLDAGLTVRIGFEFSHRYGIVRSTEVTNVGQSAQSLTILDGIRNLSTFAVDRALNSSYSYLVDGYKRSELDSALRLGIYHLNSRVTDKAEPAECLRATVVWSDAPSRRILLDDEAINNFEIREPTDETVLLGRRFNYVNEIEHSLKSGESISWRTVADVAYSQPRIEKLRDELRAGDCLARVLSDVSHGREELRRLIGSCDGIQVCGDMAAGVHHWANATFNSLRGGLLPHGYMVAVKDFIAFVSERNRSLSETVRDTLRDAPEVTSIDDLKQRCSGNVDLARLSREYFPVYLSRRHGDPSRPWNHFMIKIRDENDAPMYAYEGNWRDIFQNWEALCLSEPAWVENALTIFLNATSFDGNNAFRIKRSGIDWEVPVENDPHSNIGYWSDHQIPYFSRLLKHYYNCYPEKLRQLLSRQDFVFADIPYEIKPFHELVRDPWNTVTFSFERHRAAIAREATLGGDARLLYYKDGTLVRASLSEKIMIPILAKLANLVPGAGIWMNTMRPEWNDANNALVGRGVSIVSLAQLRAHISLFREILMSNPSDASAWNTLSAEFFAGISEIMKRAVTSESFKNSFDCIESLGTKATEFRSKLYKREMSSNTTRVSHEAIGELLNHALLLIDESLAANRRSDGLYHSYNLIDLRQRKIAVQHLPAMLEGQVAVLASGYVSAQDAAVLLDKLFKSELYCPKRRTFTLYPERPVAHFLERNLVSEGLVRESSLLCLLAEQGSPIIQRHPSGKYRFDPDFKNVKDLRTALTKLDRSLTQSDRLVDEACEIYERGLDHIHFTGRSSSMFAFEGNGSTFWHMVSKLLLAVAELAQQNRTESDGAALREYFWRIQDGLGYKKSPVEYGAFPTDPYSHTPKHAGAQQPGMTGQAKEEVLSRWIELGIECQDGRICIHPFLVRDSDFLQVASEVALHTPERGAVQLRVPAGALGFTFCGIPMRIHRSGGPKIEIEYSDSSRASTIDFTLSAEDSALILSRSDAIRCVDIFLTRS
jgi:hypothetical protein